MTRFTPFILPLAIVGTMFLRAALSFAGTPTLTTFQTRITGPTGAALEAASVNFRFTTLDSSGTCALYVEDYPGVNMGNSQGIATFSLGSGTKVFPTSAFSLYEVFNNAATSFPCQAGGSYTPSPVDRRQIVMQFNDGSGWQTLPQVAINSVPFANYANRAELLGNYPAQDFLRYATIPTCAAGQALFYNGTSLTCVAASGGGGGSGVMGLTATAPVVLTGATTTPNITITQASGSAAGFLSSADWSTFNNKADKNLTSGQLYIGNASNDATGATLSGDATLANTGIMTLSSSGVTAGTYGAANAVPTLTIDAKGRVTSATSVAYQYATGVDKGIVQIGSNITAASGVISVTSSDITNALGYTPSNAAGAFSDGGNALSADGTLGLTSNHHLLIKTNNLNRIAVLASGDVGIGTTTPNYKLGVAGDVNITGTYRINGVALSTGGGTVTNVSSANADIAVATGPTTPVLTLNSGTGANQIVKLTGAGKYPAVDGSLITNLTFSAFGTSTLPIANGGTNSSSALNNNRVMTSVGGAIVEAAALTNGQILIGSSGAAPVPSALTAGNGLIITNGAGSITPAVDTGVGIGKIPQVGAVAMAANALVLVNAAGTSLIGQTCSTNEVLKWNGTAFACANVTASSADITAAGGFLNGGNAFAADSNLGATSNYGLNFKTNNLSRISILNDGKVGIGTTTPTYPLAVTGDVNITGAFRVNGVALAAGGGTVTNISSANADIAIATGSTTPFLTLNSGTGASQVVKLTAAGKYPAVDGSLITNLNFSAFGTSTLPIANGGTNSSTALNNNRIMASVGGAIVELPAMTNGQILIGSTGAVPSASTLTAGNGILISNGVGTISPAVDAGVGISKIPQVGGVAMAANSLVMVNGTGTALLGQTCSVNEVLKWNSTNWACASGTVASSDVSTAGGFLNGGNAFAADANLGATSNYGLNFITNNTSRLSITNGGSVGIGTSSPGTKLHVYTAGAGSLADFQTGGSYAFFSATSTSGNNLFGAESAGAWLGPSSNTNLNIKTYDTTRLTIDNGGKVGVGTTAPAQLFHVYTTTADDNGGIIKYENGNTGTGSATNAQLIGKSKYGTFQIMKWENFGTRIGNRTVANSGAGDVFFTTGSDTVNMVLKDSGRLGLGTDSPGAQLEVYNTTTNNAAVLTQGVGGSGNATGFKSRPWNGMASGTYIGYMGVDDGAASARAAIMVPNSSNNGVTEALSILKSTANVGIGTAAPSAPLSVERGSGFVRLSPGWFGGTTGAWIDMDTSGPSGIGDGGPGANAWIARAAGSSQFAADASTGDIIYRNPGHLLFGNSGGHSAMSVSNNRVGIGVTDPSYQLELSSDSAAKPGTSTWTIASDGRLKNVRAPFTRGIEALLQIDPIYFSYKPGNALHLPSVKEYVGIIAQQARKAVPESVNEDEKGFLHLTNDSIIWTAVNSIKEIYYRVLGVESENWELKKQMVELKLENEKMKSRLEKIEQALSRLPASALPVK